MTLPATETFTQTNGTLVKNMTGWANNSASNGNGFTVNTNEAYPNTSEGNDNFSCNYWDGDTFDANQYSEIEVTAISATVYLGAAVRAYNPGTHHYNAYYDNVSSADCFYEKYVTGTFTALGNDLNGLSVTDVRRLEAFGTSITWKTNGTTVFSITDSSLTSGSPGIAGYNVGTTSRLDNWEGGNLTSLFDVLTTGTGTASPTTTASISPQIGSLVFVVWAANPGYYPINQAVSGCGLTWTARVTPGTSGHWGFRRSFTLFEATAGTPSTGTLSLSTGVTGSSIIACAYAVLKPSQSVTYGTWAGAGVDGVPATTSTVTVTGTGDYVLSGHAFEGAGIFGTEESGLKLADVFQDANIRRLLVYETTPVDLTPSVTWGTAYDWGAIGVVVTLDTGGDDLTATGISTTPVAGTPTIGQTHILTSTGISTTPVVGTPTLALTQVLNQLHFRWFNDDGVEGSATPAASEDVGLTLSLDTNIRLRIQLDATGDPDPNQYRLEFRKVGDSEWNVVN